MSDRSLTLLELHLDDAHVQLGPKRIGGSDEDGTEESADDTPAKTTESGGANPIAILVSVVVVLVAIGAILRRVGGPAEKEGIDLEDAASDD